MERTAANNTNKNVRMMCYIIDKVFHFNNKKSGMREVFSQSCELNINIDRMFFSFFSYMYRQQNNTDSLLYRYLSNEMNSEKVKRQIEMSNAMNI